MPAKAVGGDRGSAKGRKDVRRFMWEATSINSYLKELHQFRAKVLGITGPQWTILIALADLAREHGVPVHAVAKMMHVDPSFVTTQSKLLEKKGFLRRKPSASDARVVQMSLTKKTYKHLASLAAHQEAIDEFVFREFDNRALTEFISRLAAIKRRLEIASLRVTLDF